MPGKIAEHHSLADWDFQQGDTNRSLSAVRFINPPTSLLINNPGAGWFVDTILCRIPATLNLPQGEVRTWQYSAGLYATPAIFRNQATLGNSDFDNCYYIYCAASTIYLTRCLLGHCSVKDTTTCTTFSNEWVHYRIFWYNGKTPGEAEALCVDVYREVAGEWIKEGSTLYDTDNHFKASGINRAGIFPRIYNAGDEFWDDTEIWGPV